MTWVKTWWPVVTGVVVFVGWIITGSVEIGEMKSTSKHRHESAEEQRTDLQEEDVRIYKRIDKTDKKVSRLKKKVESTSESVVRIETNQSVIIRNQERILNKMETR